MNKSEQFFEFGLFYQFDDWCDWYQIRYIRKMYEWSIAFNHKTEVDRMKYV